jgi:hypothetical protein
MLLDRSALFFPAIALTQFTITDPEKDPPTLYWPGRNTVHRRRAPRQREGG